MSTMKSMRLTNKYLKKEQYRKAQEEISAAIKDIQIKFDELKQTEKPKRQKFKRSKLYKARNIQDDIDCYNAAQDDAFEEKHNEMNECDIDSVEHLDYEGYVKQRDLKTQEWISNNKSDVERWEKQCTTEENKERLLVYCEKLANDCVTRDDEKWAKLVGCYSTDEANEDEIPLEQLPMRDRESYEKIKKYYTDLAESLNRERNLASSLDDKDTVIEELRMELHMQTQRAELAELRMFELQGDVFKLQQELSMYRVFSKM